MVDTALITTVLAITLGGIALVVLGAIGCTANAALQNRLDDKAGVPRPDGAMPAPRAAAPTRAAESARTHDREPVPGHAA
ncbi:hypothetical protein [Nocardiopsis chromatogenes]|uniref:hypothetical protein n=1 Tax=Nocardiopsis chromatogenes TaxID=280239 RepID=UPI00034ACD81|nr:hypothetical protein [Nocardiopsis chromatogenes]